MRKAADAGNATAQYNMGIFYFQGKILKKDLDQAQQWMEKAKRNGDPDANSVLNAIRNQKAEEAGKREQQLWLHTQQNAKTAQEKKREEILVKRKTELARIMEEIKAERQAEIQRDYDNEEQAATEKLKDAQRRITETENAIAALQSLKITERIRLKGILVKAKNDKERAIQASTNAEKKRKAAHASMNDYLSEEKKRQEAKIEQLYPLPKRIYYASTSYGNDLFKQTENNKVKADIVEWMKPRESYSIEQIIENIPSIKACNMSSLRVTALLWQLKEEGWIAYVDDPKRMLYRLID